MLSVLTIGEHLRRDDTVRSIAMGVAKREEVHLCRSICLRLIGDGEAAFRSEDDIGKVPKSGQRTARKRKSISDTDGTAEIL